MSQKVILLLWVQEDKEDWNGDKLPIKLKNKLKWPLYKLFCGLSAKNNQIPAEGDDDQYICWKTSDCWEDNRIQFHQCELKSQSFVENTSLE